MVSDTATDCEQTGGGKHLPAVKFQLQGPAQDQSERGLQATLSHSFQPLTPGHPDDHLLHTLSATSQYSTGSGPDQADVSTDNQDAAQAEPTGTAAAQPPSLDTPAQDMTAADDMLPEHSLAAQMSCQASPSAEAQQPLEPAASAESVQAVDDMLPEHSLTAQMSCQASPAPSSSAEAQQPSEPAASAESAHAVDDMLPEHSLAAQMSFEAPAPSALHQIDPFAQAQTTSEPSDMLPEHSLAAQMSVDEPQADVSMEDAVTNKTKQLPHVQPHSLSTIQSGKHTHWHTHCHRQSVFGKGCSNQKNALCIIFLSKLIKSDHKIIT